MRVIDQSSKPIGLSEDRRFLRRMGEAGMNILDDFTNNYPEIPWKELARTRDKLIHGYFGIDLNLVWEIIQREIPDLKNKISRLRSE